MVAPSLVSSNVRVCPSSVRIASVFPGSYCVTVPVICSVVGLAAADVLCELVDPVVLWSWDFVELVLWSWDVVLPVEPADPVVL